jgi:S-DNA-T family DNA segregation ATPase FtsK/SpoIIIE
MLFMHSAAPAPERIHGCFLSQHEIERYAQALRAKARPTYLDLDNALVLPDGADSERDELYDTVVDFIKTTGEISISLIQRQYRIGFNRSARIIEQLELDGLITPAQGSKPRKVIR